MDQEHDVPPEETPELDVHDEPATPADAGPEDSAPSDSESPSGEEPGDKPPSSESSELPKAVQKQLDKLKRQRYEAKRQAERERQEREYWQKKAQDTAPGSTPATATGKPVVEQFQTYEEYLEALSDWKVDQRLVKERERAEETAQQQARSTRAEAYQTRVQKAIDKYEDYEEIAHGGHWTPSQAMVEAIQESESGPDVAYWLGSNPEEAERIAALGTAAQYREIGKLEERLSRPSQRRTTETPAPIKPSGAKAKASKNPEDMTFSEFNEWRRKFIAQRR